VLKLQTTAQRLSQRKRTFCPIIVPQKFMLLRFACKYRNPRYTYRGLQIREDRNPGEIAMKLGEKLRYLREVEGNLRGMDRAMTQQELV